MLNRHSETLVRRYRYTIALKISIPHVLLLAVLLSYIAFGAVVLQRIENGTNVLSRLNRHYALEKTFHALVNETWELQGRGLTYKQWQSELFDRLQNISLLYEGRRTSIDQSLPMAEWTFPTAVLYALTVLTACGYNFIDPVTDGGKVFAIAFALVGIPLMFITAADIGKFLSETFQRVCVWSNRLYRAFLSNFSRKDKEVNQNRRLSASEKNTIFDDLADEANEDELGSDSLWFPIGAYHWSAAVLQLRRQLGLYTCLSFCIQHGGHCGHGQHFRHRRHLPVLDRGLRGNRPGGGDDVR
ncbi:uncoordinated protein 58 [Trichinella spiralis]|uniref:uncoordinated protein 58 n=1 Tax=Trichinella spiralis TaxID=6334 RepID=UPI0001EFC2A8|nr:uncoordinated protein 58 [Trichinella spiralis]